MPTDIFNQLSEISKGRYGADIRNPIHDALAILSDSDVELITRNAIEPINSPVLSDYDITEELQKIANNHEGAVVKQAIYDALLKLSKMHDDSRTVITGLTGIDLTTMTDPSDSDPNYIYLLDDENQTDYEALAAFLRSTGLFSNVIYDEIEGFEKGLTTYIDGEPFVSLNYALDWDDPTSGVWLYQIHVNTSGTGLSSSVLYPEHTDELSLQYAMNPVTAYKSPNGVLICCQGDAVLFARNSAGGVSVTFGAGYEKHTTVADPRSKIRTITYDSTLSDSSGIGHSYSDANASHIATLTALVSEGDEAVSYKGYALTTGWASNAEGFVEFGSKRLYIAKSMLAIEVW